METTEVLRLLRLKLNQVLTDDTVRRHGRGISLQKLRHYAEGNQFGEGHYWRGRIPEREDFTEVEKTFTQNNQIGKAFRAIIAGVLGKDLEWDVTDEEERGPDKVPQLQSIQELLSAWHLDSGLWRRTKEVLFMLLWGATASFRIYIPNEYAEEVQEGKVSTLEDALEYIHIQAIDATEGGAITDEHGRQVGYFYRYQEERARVTRDFVELHTPEEIGIYIEEGDSFALVEDDGRDNPVANPLFDPRRKRRPHYLMHMFEREGGSAISPDVIDNQDALNISSTYRRRNDDFTGFRTIITFNAAGPTDEEDNPIPWTFAAAKIAELKGEPIIDPLTDEVKGISTPAVEVIDPLQSSLYSIPDIVHLQETLLEDLGMGFIRAVQKAVSGDSKKESRWQYEKVIQAEAEPLYEGLVWALSTVLRLADWLSTEKIPDVDKVVFTVRLFLDIHRGSIDEFVAMIDAWERGAASEEVMLESNPLITNIPLEQGRLIKLRKEREDQEAKEAAANPKAAIDVFDREDAAE